MSDLLFPSRDCPICDAEASRVLFQQRFGDFGEGSLLTGYDVSVCGCCGFVYADRIPPQAAFDQHYAEMSKYEYTDRGGEVSPRDSERFTDIAALISKSLPDRGIRILDIGCATGGLLAALRNLGYENVRGLDPSPSCARLAKKFYDIRVDVGTITANPLPADSFDLAIVVGVLEHVRDLRPALKNIEKCLSPHGYVYAEVPDLSAFLDWPGAPFQEFSTEHIGFFGPKSLENLFRALSYKMIAMDLIPRQFTDTTVMPSACGLFQRSAETATASLQVDYDTEPVLKSYIKRSEVQEKRVAVIMADLAATGRDVAVWGVGTHTRRRLKTTLRSKANITAFVDNKSNYHGKTLHGRPILSPQEMKSHPEAILVGSLAFQDEIVSLIRNDLAMKNEVILLYEGGR